MRHASSAPGWSPLRTSLVRIHTRGPRRPDPGCRSPTGELRHDRARARIESAPAVRFLRLARGTRRPAEHRARAGCGHRRCSTANHIVRVPGRRWPGDARHRPGDSQTAAQSAHRHPVPWQSAVTRRRSRREESCEPADASEDPRPRVPLHRRWLRCRRVPVPRRHRVAAERTSPQVTGRRELAKYRARESGRLFPDPSCGGARRPHGRVPRSARADAAHGSTTRPRRS